MPLDQEQPAATAGVTLENLDGICMQTAAALFGISEAAEASTDPDIDGKACGDSNGAREEASLFLEPPAVEMWPYTPAPAQPADLGGLAPSACA